MKISVDEFRKMNYKFNAGISSSKFKNKKTDFNGQTFHSKKEADYAKLLNNLKKASNKSERVISWESQVPYPIEINGVKICKYILDFKVLYFDGHMEYIDVKGVRTSVYILKSKLMKACYGIEIKEV